MTEQSVFLVLTKILVFTDRQVLLYGTEKETLCVLGLQSNLHLDNVRQSRTYYCFKTSGIWHTDCLQGSIPINLVGIR